MLNIKMFHSMCLNKEKPSTKTNVFVTDDILWIYESDKFTIYWDSSPGQALPCCVCLNEDSDSYFWGSNLNDAWSRMEASIQ